MIQAHNPDAIRWDTADTLHEDRRFAARVGRWAASQIVQHAPIPVSDAEAALHQTGKGLFHSLEEASATLSNVTKLAVHVREITIDDTTMVDRVFPGDAVARPGKTVARYALTVDDYDLVERLLWELNTKKVRDGLSAEEAMQRQELAALQEDDGSGFGPKMISAYAFSGGALVYKKRRGGRGKGAATALMFAGEEANVGYLDDREGFVNGIFTRLFEAEEK